jgi:hypothetical protein
MAAEKRDRLAKGSVRRVDLSKERVAFGERPGGIAALARVARPERG